MNVQFVVATVRQKVKELVALIQDDDALRDERKKAKKNKDKYIGMSGGLSGQHYGQCLELLILCFDFFAASANIIRDSGSVANTDDMTMIFSALTDYRIKTDRQTYWHCLSVPCKLCWSVTL